MAQAKGQTFLMDINLPVIGEWEATRRLTADPATRPSRSSRGRRIPWPAIARRRW